MYEEKSHELDVRAFLKRVHKYSEIKELTHEILNEFIDKIVVHHREQVDNQTIQRAKIYYKMVGKIEIPFISKNQMEMYIKHFGKDMKGSWHYSKEI